MGPRGACATATCYDGPFRPGSVHGPFTAFTQIVEAFVTVPVVRAPFTFEPCKSAPIRFAYERLASSRLSEAMSNPRRFLCARSQPRRYTFVGEGVQSLGAFAAFDAAGLPHADNDTPPATNVKAKISLRTLEI
jgi:hypothetical protein